MANVTDSMMNQDVKRKPLEVLNLISERNSESAIPQTRNSVHDCLKKSQRQLLNVCSSQKPFKCKFCPKQFACSQRLERHTKWHTKNPFQCQFCECGFETTSELKKHILSHGDKSFLGCDHCNKPQKCYSFNYTRKKPGRYPCESCGRSFSLLSVLVTHLRWHTQQKIFTCKYCKVTFAYSAQFRWHQTNCQQKGKLLIKYPNKKPGLQYRSLVKDEQAQRVENVPSVRVGVDMQSGCNININTSVNNRLSNSRSGTSGQFKSEEGYEEEYISDQCFGTVEMKEEKPLVLSALSQDHFSEKEQESTNSLCQVQNLNSYIDDLTDPYLSKINVLPHDLIQKSANNHTPLVHCTETFDLPKISSANETSESPTRTQGLLKCPDCSRTFFFQESLDKHLNRHNKLKRHTCEYCKQSFTMVSILNAHLQKHTGEMPYKCHHCQMTFTYSAQLHRHKKVCFSPMPSFQEEQSSVERPKARKNSVTSSNTEYQTYLNDNNLDTYGSNHSLGHEQKNIAGMFYPMTNSTLVTSYHTSPEIPTSRLFNAKENQNCDLKTTPRTSVKASMSPQEENVFHMKVDKINSDLTKPGKNYLQHPTQRTPSTSIPPQMPQKQLPYENPSLPSVPDPQSSKSKSKKINSSKNGNANEKCFPCRSCGKSFSLAHNLKQHVRTHTGERPFKCDYCQARFSKSSILIVHLRRHTGEKPYGCKNCRRMFTHLTQLHRHLRVCRWTTSDATYPADFSQSETTRVISLGPNSFKKLTFPKARMSLINIDQDRTNQNGNIVDNNNNNNDNNDKSIGNTDKYTFINSSDYTDNFSASSTSAVNSAEFQPQSVNANLQPAYSVILSNQDNLYINPEPTVEHW